MKRFIEVVEGTTKKLINIKYVSDIQFTESRRYQVLEEQDDPKLDYEVTGYELNIYNVRGKELINCYKKKFSIDEYEEGLELYKKLYNEVNGSDSD